MSKKGDLLSKQGALTYYKALNIIVYIWSGNDISEIILAIVPANGRRRYIVALSFIGWAHTHNVPYTCKT